MATISQNPSHSAKHSLHTSSHTSEGTTDFWLKVEEIRFGIIPLLFILIPCLAGIASSSALSANNMFLFTVAGAPAMIVETLILGMASMKSVVISSIVSCVISFIIMAIYFI